MSTSSSSTYIGQVLDKRYEVLELIGSGSMGQVFKIHDSKKNQTKALKLVNIHKNKVPFEALLRFRTEGDILKNLQHPSVIKYFDFFNEGDLYGLVMEYLPYPNLAEYLKKSGPFSLQNALLLVKALTEAMMFIHDKKLVHLDLKPSNILISFNESKDMEIKILDFGFSQIIGMSETKTGGTLSYMAPEQTGILHKTIDHRADLYALGIILYEILVGQVPFKDSDPAMIVYQHIAQIPENPSQMRHDLPSVFEKIVLKLISKDPDDRYRTTGGLLNDLEKYERLLADDTIKNKDFTLGENDHWESFPMINPFVGRLKEKEAVFSIVNDMTPQSLKLGQEFPFQINKKTSSPKFGRSIGKGGLLLIEGSKGVGKTFFLKEVFNELQSQPGITWFHETIQEEYETPFRAIKTILKNLEDYIKRLKHTQQYSVRKFLQKRLKDEFGIIKEFLPSLTSLIPEFDFSKGKQVRTRTSEDYFNVIFDLLVRITRIEKRLIIIIDNFQFVESTSSKLLFKLISQIENLPILFVLSYNYGELSEAHKNLIIDHIKSPLSHHLLISPLSETEVAELMQKLFSDKLFEMPKLLDSVYYSTQGNPSQIRNILQKLIDRRLIFFENQTWQAKTDQILSFIKEQRTVNATLAPLIDWSKEEVNALARGSIFLRSFSFEALKALCKVPPEIPLFEDNLLSILHTAVRSNILNVNSRKLYSFSDNNIRYALLRDLTEDLRTSLYSTVATYLENNILPHSPDSVCDIARHWDRAGDQLKAMYYYIKSAELTDNGMFNDRQAEIYYQKALICLNKLGPYAPDDDELQFNLRYNSLKHTFSFSREYEVLWEQLNEMSPYVKSDKSRQLRFLGLQIALSFVAGNKPAMLQYGKILTSMEIEPEHEVYTVESIIQLGSVVSDKSFEERLELLKQGLEMAIRNELYHLTISPSIVFAILCCHLLKFDKAEDLLTTYSKKLDKPGLEGIRVLLINWSRLYIEIEKGNFKQALEYGEYLSQYQHLAGPIAIGLYQAAMGYVHGMLGHYSEALQIFDKLLPRIEKAKQRVEALPIVQGRIHVALRMKEPETALIYCETAQSILELRPDPFVEAIVFVFTAIAFLDLFQYEKAQENLDWAKEISKKINAPLLDFHIGFTQIRKDWLSTADPAIIEKGKNLLNEMLDKGVEGYHEIYSEQLDSWQLHPARSSASVSLYNNTDTSLLKLFEISYKITTTHQLDDLFNAALEGAMQIAGANHAYLFTCTDMEACDGNEFMAPRVTRNAQGNPIPENEHQFSKTLLRTARIAKEIIITRDARSEKSWESSQSIQSHQLRSVLVAPIIFDDILKGFIYLDNNHAKSVFTTKDKETVGIFATQVAIALNNAESFAKQQKISAENERLYEEIKEYNKTLEQQVKARTQELNDKTQQLQELNKNLEHRVNMELDRRLEQEQLLIQQSKMAAMGEMIGMIAHQWRQPLSSISTVAGNMQIFLDLDRVDKTEFSQLLETINEQVQFLSNTINDFRDFFSPKKRAEQVNLEETVAKTLMLIGKSLDNKSITLENNCHFETTICTYANEVMQVFLNILKNAQDILLEKEVQNAKITIESEETETFHKVVISDNAGGVPEEIKDKIFEPYFSTKDEKTGTGLGLYMSKMIIEKHCGGELEVKNTKEGASFHILLPLDFALGEK